MTRQDYELIAAALNEAHHYAPETMALAVPYVARYLVRALRTDNPRFNETKFMEACTK